MKISDEDLGMLGRMLRGESPAGHRLFFSERCALETAILELLALRKVAEAAKEYVLSSDADEPGWESDYDALRVALKEAGYGA